MSKIFVTYLRKYLLRETDDNPQTDSLKEEHREIQHETNPDPISHLCQTSYYYLGDCEGHHTGVLNLV